MLKRLKFMIISIAAMSLLCGVDADSALNQMRHQIKRLYKSLEDFDNTILYCNRQVEVYRPAVIIALYEHMTTLGHTNDLAIATSLFEKMKQQVPKAPNKYSKLLNESIETLVNDKIIPKSAELLESGDSVNITRFIDWVKNDTHDIADRVLSRYWESVRSKSPNPVDSIAGTSKELRQNLFLVLSLYKMHKEGGRYDKELIEKMRQMSKKPEFTKTVAKQRQEDVRQLIASIDSTSTTSTTSTSSTITAVTTMTDIETTTKRTTTSTLTTSTISYPPKDTSELPSVDPQFIKQIEKIYDNTLANYQKTIDFIEERVQPSEKGDYLIALHHVMHKLSHVNDVLDAIPLHDELAKCLDVDAMSIPTKTQIKLISSKTYLVEQTIMPQSLDLMVNQTSRMKIAKLIDLIYNSTDTLAGEIIAEYWDIIVKKLNVEPVQRAVRVSPYVSQNIYMVLMLHKLVKFSDKRLDVIHEVLKLLMQGPDSKATLSSEHQRQIERVYALTASFEVLQNVIKLYGENFDNYDKVIQYMDDSDGIERKGSVVLALYDVMKKANHLHELLRVLELYRTVEERLNCKSHRLRPNQLIKMNTIRGELFEILKPDSYSALETAVNDGKSNKVVSSLLNLLVALGNRTVLNETLGRVWEKVEKDNGAAVGKMLKIGETLQQKIKLLLALVGLDSLSQHHMLLIIDKLSKMKDDSKYKILPEHIKIQVERAVTKVWFLRKVVYIYKPTPVDGKLYFLQQCDENAELACVKSKKNHMRLFLPYTTNQSHLKLGIPHYKNHLCLKGNANERDGKAFNVYTKSRSNDEFYWHAETNHEDNTVTFSDEHKNRFLCSDVGEANAYTRKRETYENNREDCRWRVDVWI